MIRLRSVFTGKDCDLLPRMLSFYAPDARDILDVTANARRMWRGVETMAPVHFVDIDPAMNPDTVADFRALPFPAESWDLIVFDPPHLPAAAASPKSYQGFAKRNGLSHGGTGNNISHLFPPFLAEAHRILRPDGLIFSKIKTFVHNHAFQATLCDFTIAVRETPGLTHCDEIVKFDPVASNLTSGKWEKAHHARGAHCFWVVVRKGRCEPRGRVMEQIKGEEGRD